jgi:hypothetical protein
MDIKQQCSYLHSDNNTNTYWHEEIRGRFSPLNNELVYDDRIIVYLVPLDIIEYSTGSADAFSGFH